ncbi:MAG: thiolase family protein [Armatimonadetes bacterium]|nr:thiolase family protein [Armatimonadota bacterium]
MKNGRQPVILSAVRTPVGRGRKGSLTHTRPDDLAALVLKAVLERVGVEPGQVEDVLLGCAQPEAEQGFNIARQAVLLAGFPVEVPAATVNRFCSSGLQAVALAAQSIASGMTDCVIAGGIESMSMIPMGGAKISMNLRLLEQQPGAYLGMGLTAEKVAARYEISRQEQDEFALLSHQRAAAAQDARHFDDELVPVPVRVDRRHGAEIVSDTIPFAVDELVRRDTTLEALATLRPAFKVGGTVTAGNSSPYSDGAAALLLASPEKAEELGIEPLGRFLSFAVGGVPPEIMGIGPVAAVPKALEKAGIQLKDLAVIELNEAFAAQSLAVMKELGLPRERTNPNGGAIALGHPLGCTGAKLTATAVHELRRRGGGYGLITMCIGGGQGAAGVIRV